ncbi:MAG TPA: hypothetical protein VJ853_15385 [Thermoanaerobaculia bacterium]|nr:hypothetical protein [Thermoanaerobaculia bacterium]
MNSTLAIARRELAEKRFVFITAAAFLALALIVPFMPGVHDGERAGALVIASLTLATALSVGLAAILGSSIIGRDLSDGRLSFYFSKPVAATSIWWGKLLAATTLILAAFVIVGFPALLAGGSAALSGWTAQGTWQIFGFILIAAAALFLLSHVIGTFVRSRSAWFLFDFVAAVICGTAMWMLMRALLDGFAHALVARILEPFTIFLALAVIAAGAWQLERGRTDRKRSHMELSRFLWMSIGCCVLLIAVFVAWVVSVRPADLRIDRAAQSNSTWTFIDGIGKYRGDYRASFLYNIREGRSIRITELRPMHGTFSLDSNLAFWMVPSRGAFDLWMANLTDASPKPVRTPITLAQASVFATAADGSRAAAAQQGILSVYDTRSGNLLGSARVAAGSQWWFGYFVTPDVVRLLVGEAMKPASILEYDVRTKTLSRTGQLARASYRTNVDRSRVLVNENEQLAICDAHTGAVLNAIPGKFGAALFLRDGRIVAIGSNALHVFDASGSPRRVVPLPPAKREAVTDLGNGFVVLTAFPGGSVLVDVNRGSVVRAEAGIRPTAFGRVTTPLLAFTVDDTVIWNPMTGERRAIR